MERLAPSQITERLSALSGWNLQGSSIGKRYTFKDFREAIGFLLRVAFLAEAADHHPDIDIRYRQVTLRLSTHSAGGLTEKDFALAREIDA